MIFAVSIRMRLTIDFMRRLPSSLLKPLASLKNFWISGEWEIFTVMAQASSCSCGDAG